MCGILFSKNSIRFLNAETFKNALLKQSWRGPDAVGVSQENFGVHLGHVRLSILDLSDTCNQPMLSKCGRFKIIFNGEIYNHLDIRRKFNLNCSTASDTETVLEAFCKEGTNVFDMLNGMFALVVYEISTGNWWSARDRHGIKPLFKYDINGHTVIASETVSIRHIVGCSVSQESLSEWQMIRRPIPGATFFNEIEEVLPGSVLCNGKVLFRLSLACAADQGVFDQDLLQEIIRKSVETHELSHVDNVCLLSGGIDSSIITALSTSQKAYTVGLEGNNEITEARETASLLSKVLEEIRLCPELMIDAWKYLIELRGEPLSVPNEGLIYLVCNSMKASEKVVLTGEGADEIFFGYDRIYREASLGSQMTLDKFYDLYSYSEREFKTERLDNYIQDLMYDKTNIQFVEDFFLQTHMTGLLRRMDMSSMAASKEARVPFVTRTLIDYMYRRPAELKINSDYSKIPLRKMCVDLGLTGPVNRKKIGFSSTLDGVKSRFDEYNNFRKFNLEVLGW